MLVNLEKEFRAVNGTLYSPDNNPHDFPDDWVLPSTAEKLSAKEAKAAKAADVEEE